MSGVPKSNRRELSVCLSDGSPTNPRDIALAKVCLAVGVSIDSAVNVKPETSVQCVLFASASWRSADDLQKDAKPSRLRLLKVASSRLKLTLKGESVNKFNRLT